MCSAYARTAWQPGGRWGRRQPPTKRVFAAVLRTCCCLPCAQVNGFRPLDVASLSEGTPRCAGLRGTHMGFLRQRLAALIRGQAWAGAAEGNASGGVGGGCEEGWIVSLAGHMLAVMACLGGIACLLCALLLPRRQLAQLVSPTAHPAALNARVKPWRRVDAQQGEPRRVVGVLPGEGGAQVMALRDTRVLMWRDACVPPGARHVAVPGVGVRLQRVGPAQGEPAQGARRRRAAHRAAVRWVAHSGRMVSPCDALYHGTDASWASEVPAPCDAAG